MPGQAIQYVAFLRGINVGGHGVIKMAEIKRIFESLKFKNVKTILASGNVLFESTASDPSALTLKVEKRFSEVLGREIGIVLRTFEHLQELAASEPFKSVKVTPDTRLYVTFLREQPVKGTKIKTTDAGFRILRTTDTEIFCVLTLAGGGQTVDAMNVIEKEYGKQVTTRNWNTINKIIASGSKE
jgi:uncharacterized protein (DUF1697 family)